MAGIVQDPVGLAARKQALVKIGTDIAASISRQLSVKYGDFVPVTLNRIAIEDLCDRYWGRGRLSAQYPRFKNAADLALWLVPNTYDHCGAVLFSGRERCQMA